MRKQKIVKRKVAPLQCTGRQVMSYEQGLLLTAYAKELKRRFKKETPKIKLTVQAHPLYSVVDVVLHTDTELPIAALYFPAIDAYNYGGARVHLVAGITVKGDWISDYDDTADTESISEEPVIVVNYHYPSIRGAWGNNLVRSFNISQHWDQLYSF